MYKRQVQEDRFSRIVELGDLPNPNTISADFRIDVRALLDLRDSAEVHEMRSWLRGIDSNSDFEIIEQFHSVKEKMRRFFASDSAKVLRLLVTTGFSLPTGYGLPMGIGASLADQFLLDKFIKRPGPITFLSNNYSSIYEEPHE